MPYLNRSNFHGYQDEATQYYIDNPKCASWILLGGGKTVTTLTACRDLIDSMEVCKVLIIAPLRVANSVWHTEVKNWEHLQHTTVQVCTGSENKRIDSLGRDAEIYVINRENIVWLVEYYGKKWPFDMVVIDESSSFKNHSSKRWKALRKVSKFITRMIQLTGTPAPNGLGDLWAQMFLLDGGESLGKTYTAFRNRYFESDYMGFNYTLREGADEQIHAKIADKVFSVEIKARSERVDIRRTADFTPALRKKYSELEKNFIAELEDIEITAFSAAALTNKLNQFCNGAIYDAEGNTVDLHNIKLDILKEIVEESDEPMLVAYNYKSDLKKLLATFPDAVQLDTDNATIEKWNRGEIKMLLAHPASAGHGLNLQKGGSLMVWFGLNWSLELYQQFVGRLDRQGQNHLVRNIHIMIENAIDDKIMLAIDSKAKTQAELIEFIKNSYQQP